MKKIFAALLAVFLLLTSALAEGAPAGQDAGSITLNILDKTVVLNYDPEPEYSNSLNGSIQASFYTEETDGTMYELYLLFPETVKAGDEVNTQSSIQAGLNDAGVMIFITSDAMELNAAAFQYPTGAYPAGSQYSIKFDTVTPAGASCTYAGSMTATLMVIDAAYNPLYPINNVSGNFSFTFDTGNAYAPRVPEQPSATPVPESSEATPAPFAPAQPEASPTPVVPLPEPYVPIVPSVPKNTPSLITPADAKKI